MKNADKPAMPITNDQLASALELGAIGASGLTKREMFAMHAPILPFWFIDDWLTKNAKLYSIEGGHELIGSSRGSNISTVGMMKLERDWRYAYAELMLDE